jgi:hypothetical protein
VGCLPHLAALGTGYSPPWNPGILGFRVPWVCGVGSLIAVSREARWQHQNLAGHSQRLHRAVLSPPWQLCQVETSDEPDLPGRGGRNRHRIPIARRHALLVGWHS